MARLIIVSKYPPLEGGMSSWAFWVTGALAARGHEVHVITDPAGIEPDYSIPDGEWPIPEGVFVHRIPGTLPWHVPNDTHRALSLMDETLRAIEGHPPDALLGAYLVPYGAVAGLAGIISGNRWYVRPGGSDIHKFYNGGVWENVLQRVLSGASRVITDATIHEILAPACRKASVQVPYVPPPGHFTPVGRMSTGKAVLGILGKVNYYWRHKKLDLAIEICKALEDRFRFTIQAQGVGAPAFRAYVDALLPATVTWKSFVHPTEMPDELRVLDAVFCFVGGLPHPSFSNILVEALCCGTMVITDCPDLEGIYRQYGWDLQPFKDLIIKVDPQQPAQSAGKIATAIDHRQSISARLSPDVFESFITCVETTLFDLAG